MAGLAPAIHEARLQREAYVRLLPQHGPMDCRVKPGNDELSLIAG